VYIGAKYQVYNGTNITLRDVNVTGSFRGSLQNEDESAGCFNYNSNLSLSTFVWNDFDVKPGETECLELWVNGLSTLLPSLVYGPASINFVADGVGKPGSTTIIYSKYPAIGGNTIMNTVSG
jgi:hypothetical protein